jgi:hypothetical protein
LLQLLLALPRQRQILVWRRTGLLDAPVQCDETYMAQITSVKDVQAHLRHTNAKTTLEHYIKSVPESVRVAVESLDQFLKKRLSGSETPAN